MSSQINRSDSINEDRRSVYTVSSVIGKDNPFASKGSTTSVRTQFLNVVGRLEEEGRGEEVANKGP